MRLDAIVQVAFAFPDWSGRNWDAVYDCLTDQRWDPSTRILLGIEGPPAGSSLSDRDRSALQAVFVDAADFWTAHGVSLFAVWVGSDRDPSDGLDYVASAHFALQDDSIAIRGERGFEQACIRMFEKE